MKKRRVRGAWPVIRGRLPVRRAATRRNGRPPGDSSSDHPSGSHGRYPTSRGRGAAVVVLLSLSAFFSSSETAIFSLPREWIEQQATTGDGQARVLKELHDDPHRLLVTLLVGNNIVNIAISSITTVLIATYLPPGPAIVVTTVFTSVLILIFGEIVPKAFGLGNAKRWALTTASPVRLVERVLSPLIPTEVSIERPYMD